jgi:CRISPR/Cas system type I-B associated protein Csh2 (Cas7 group RAMP superfamily)
VPLITAEMYPITVRRLLEALAVCDPNALVMVREHGSVETHYLYFAYHSTGSGEPAVVLVHKENIEEEETDE